MAFLIQHSTHRNVSRMNLLMWLYARLTFHLLNAFIQIFFFHFRFVSYGGFRWRFSSCFYKCIFFLIVIQFNGYKWFQLIYITLYVITEVVTRCCFCSAIQLSASDTQKTSSRSRARMTNERRKFSSPTLSGKCLCTAKVIYNRVKDPTNLWWNNV